MTRALPIAVSALLGLGGCEREPAWPPRTGRPETAEDSAADTAPDTADDTGTEPAPDPVRFAVIGDYGEAGEDEAAVAALVAGWDPDFILTVGDNNYFNGGADTIEANIGQYYADWIHPYVGAYGEGAKVNRFFPTLGNHDWMAEGAQPYLDYFELPGNERYYTFSWGAADFFAVDSDDREPDGNTVDSVQGAWLAEAMAASTATWKIVAFHHAAYSSGRHGSSEHMRWPFREFGAQLVLAGHDHLYERLLEHGVYHVTDGAGGAMLYELEDQVEGSQAGQGDLHGAVRVELSETELRLAFVTVDGDRFDEVLVRAGQPLDSEEFGADGTWLVPAEASWRYRQDGEAPPEGWTSADYDATGWAAGPGPLGYGQGDEGTTLDYGDDAENKPIAAWFRHTFVVDDPGAWACLLLQLQRDDGVVLWLNGVEILRSNLSDDALGADAPAALAVADWFETATLTSHVDPALLVEGTNVLAAEVHQASASSTDLRFAATLMAR